MKPWNIGIFSAAEFEVFPVAVAAEGDREIRQLPGRDGAVQQRGAEVGEGEGDAPAAGEEAVDLHEGEAGGEGFAVEDAGVVGGEGVGVAEDAGPAGGMKN